MATIIDLTTGETVVQDGVIFSTDVTTVGAGTGLIEPFLGIQAQGNNTTEQGFNTDFRPVPLDANSSTNFTHSLALADVPIEIINGIAYYRFELDINEPNTDTNLLSLDNVQIYQANSGNLSAFSTGVNPAGGTFSLTGATLVYNLDAGSDFFIGLDGNLQPGSGNTVDMSMLIPVSEFDQSLEFVYLYSAFGFQGGQWNADSGFEEWNTQVGVDLSGHKFNDLNINGIFDSGEPLLPGWTIYIDVNLDNVLDAGDISTVTDANGFYEFGPLVPGTYSIREVLQAGWAQSAPGVADNGEFNITLVAGEDSTGNDFGNFQQATKSGTKFHDLDADGEHDAGEPGLAAWVIHLDGTDGLGNAVNLTDVTDADGNYSFTVNPGTYTVSEEQQAGWTQSGPDLLADAGDNDAGATDGDWDIVLTSGENETGNDFGNFQQATKSGTKFNDLNHNGVRDAGEPGLAAWVIHLDGTDGLGNAVNLTDVTDADGNYSFTVNPGTYTVSEEQQAGWTQSGPDLLADAGDNDAGATDGDWDIVLTSGQIDSGNDFGNFQPPAPPAGGTAQTPGFWKNHPEIANEELGEFQVGLDVSDFYEDVFGVTLNGPASFNPTLLEALGANGGGQNALLRHSTAAFINAASDAVDEDGSGPQDELNFSFAGLVADPSILTILNQMDLNDDLKLNPDEVINAVQDVYNDSDADTSFFGLVGQPGITQVADAFAAMNEQPHLDAHAF
jgi:hypothetical protein